MKIYKPNLRHFKAKNLLIFAFAFSIVYRFLCDYLGMPSAFRYIIDFCLLLCLIISGPAVSKTSRHPISRYIVIYLVYCCIAYILHYQSPVYFLYGLVFYFRYYLFFILFIANFKEKDAYNCLQFVYGLFYVNAFICLLQYFVFGFYGDNLGGIFGFVQGCNGYLNVYLIVTLSISLYYYLNHRENIWQFIIKIIICLGIASVAELKFFFIEFLAIVLFSVMFTGFSWKKLWIILSSGIAVIGGVYLISRLYPYFISFLNVNTWLDLSTSGSYASGYGGVGQVNRLTFVTVLNSNFLVTDLLRLTGLGIGNCAFSSIPLFNTPFYERFSRIRYQWFTSAHTYLEQGWIGILLYLGFFVFIFLLGRKKRKEGSSPLFCFLSQGMCIISLLIFLYNNTLTMESGFLIYFIIGLPFISQFHEPHHFMKESRSSDNVMDR